MIYPCMYALQISEPAHCTQSFRDDIDVTHGRLEEPIPLFDAVEIASLLPKCGMVQ